jgi:hypothetical protein
VGITIWGGFLPLLPLDHQSATRIYIAECMAEDGEEFEMNTKINGRILATNKYTEI